jgi:uncharacterized protein (DUF305 family)
VKGKLGWAVFLLAGVLIGLGSGWLIWAGTSADHHSSSSAAQSSTTGSPTDPNAADIGFAQDMSVHHNQALQMSTYAMANTKDVTTRRLALQILTSQATEKGVMSGLLIMWEAPELPSGPHMAWMEHMDHSQMHSDKEQGLMPGMASLPEMKQLGRARGRDFDILFLQLMMRHHAGGIEMARAAVEQANTSAVQGMALEMARTQTQENAVMLARLKELGAAPLS